MPGMVMIKTTDKGLIDKLIRMKIPVRHTSGSLIPGKKVWFFEIDEKIVKKDANGKCFLSDEELKAIVFTKVSEIENLIKYPKAENPVSKIGDDVLVAELEKRGFVVKKEEKKDK